MRVSELVSDLQVLRETLSSQLAIINRSEPAIDSLSHDEARAAVKNVVDDAKQSVAELMHVIELLDPRQREAARSRRGQ
jgi:hypothetical protein